MSSNPPKKTIPEQREHTDKSLRHERDTSDRSLEDRLSDAEEDADEIVQRARDNADSVLLEAREKADQLKASSHPQVHQSKIEQGRVLEDKALQAERDTADEVLRSERDANLQRLKKLLPLERSTTDSFLLTERKNSDAAISNRDDFLGIVSHDLRTLLGAIVMTADAMSLAAADAPNGKLILSGTERIQRNAACMNRLLSDFVDIASIEAGKLEVNKAENDAFILMREALDIFRPIALEKGVELQMDAKSPLISHFDYDRMLQIMANLISNSLKFTPPGGRICVCGEISHNALRIKVTDTGTGIPENLLEAVFDRFWQRITNVSRGSGLGLYITRFLIEAHGGKIKAESDPGKGSQFSFHIPLS